MIYGYIRVSTDKQTIENQRFEINHFVEKQHMKIDKWIEETISGNTRLEKRKLFRLIRKIKKDDILIASELSRLGRNLFQVMTILNHCLSVQCQVWTIKDNYRLGADVQSKVLAFAFGLSAELERNLISQRTKEALARLKSEGRKLGRSVGSKNKHHILDGKESQIKKLLDMKVPQSQIAKILGVHRDTVRSAIDKIQAD